MTTESLTSLSRRVPDAAAAVAVRPDARPELDGSAPAPLRLRPAYSLSPAAHGLGVAVRVSGRPAS